MQDALKRSEGTFTFEYNSFYLFDPLSPGGKFCEIIAGAQYILLEENDKRCLHFHHSSPGTQTRVATVDLGRVRASQNVFFAMTWSTEETSLYVGSCAPSASGIVSANGTPSKRQFRIGEGGSIF